MTTLTTSKSLDRILQYLTSTTAHTELLDISPVEAQFLLDRNPNNRPQSEVDIATYQRVMNAGGWVDNGDTIKVAQDGHLNDGQHRLQAVVRSGATVPMRVAFGVPRESRHTLDQGRKRTTGNIIDMLSGPMAYGNQQSQIAQWLMHFDASGGKRIKNSRLKFSPHEIQVKALSEPDILNTLRYLQPYYRSGHKDIVSTAALAFVSVLLKKQSKQQALVADFIDQTATGINNHPVVAMLRNRMLTEGKTKAERKIALMLKAWNAFAGGQLPKVLNVGKLTQLPTIL